MLRHSQRNIYLPENHPSLGFYCLSMMLYGMEYPFDEFGSAVLVKSLLTSCTPQNCLIQEQRWRKREHLDVTQVLLSNSQNIVVLSTLF